MEEHIAKLRGELKAKEAELNEAILARGGPDQALSNISIEVTLPKPTHCQLRYCLNAADDANLNSDIANSGIPQRFVHKGERQRREPTNF